ncbi:putative RNA methyltransferase [Oceanobacillus sp. CAU 1775]
MNKKKPTELVRTFEGSFRCPLCESEIRINSDKSMVCTKNHTFDFAKQGYVNMLNRAGNTQYNKELFTARHDIIIESNLYDVLHERISEVMKKKLNIQERALVLDAGSGEGSHLNRILQKNGSERLTGIGIDISKEGIRMAASKYKDAIWFVGDLANIPVADEAIQVILNILSPANYQEFKRVLDSDGLMIKVVPGTNYLKEFRQAIFDNTENESYGNEEIISLFKTHFQTVHIEKVNDKRQLTKNELKNLVHMSPLGWNAKQEVIEELLNRDKFEITIDLDILIGMK